MNYSDMVEINVEVEALNLDGIKQNLLDYVQKEVKISIEESVEQAGKSAENAGNAANIAEDAAISATESARQASESLGLYYTKEQSDTLLSSKQDTITGAATTITDNNLTANRALISNSNGKVDVASTTTTELNYVHGVTSAIQTQLNAKASTALDNLSSDGQMIIDSANGTISNCILEIPQNLKLTLENNVLTLKAGSTITLTGSIYTTFTTTSDNSKTYSPISSQRNKRNYVFCSFTGSLSNLYPMDQVKSGSTSSRPETAVNGEVFFDTDEKSFYQYNNGWTTWNVVYPLCMIDVDENNVMSFAKDSNGRDMIFNGAGFIGHHAFVYPNVISLCPDGFDNNGKLKSKLNITNSFSINEMGRLHTAITVSIVAQRRIYKVVQEKDTSFTSGVQYIEPLNIALYGENLAVRNETPLVYFDYDGTTITQFDIRQPYERARYLLTDDLYKKIGDVETLLAAI